MKSLERFGVSFIAIQILVRVISRKVSKNQYAEVGLRGDFGDYNAFLTLITTILNSRRPSCQEARLMVRYLFNAVCLSSSDMLLETVVKLLVDKDRKIKITIAGSGDYHS